jgi:ketosteroid isomerase-like protein
VGQRRRIRLAHPHITLTKAFWEAVAAADADALRLLLAEDIVWRAAGLNPLSGDYRGVDEVLGYFADIGERVDALASALTSVYVNDEGAVVEYHVSARRGSHHLEMDYLLRLRMDGGRVKDAVLVAVDQRQNDDFWV